MALNVSQREFREKIIECFRTELAEHLDTLRKGLESVETGAVSGAERADTLHAIYRAAHTMKGAARAVGVTIVEQMARSLENVLYALKMEVMEPSPELFQACRQTLEAIQVVRFTYENEEIVPPNQATLALMELDELWNPQVALRKYSLKNLQLDPPLAAAESLEQASAKR